MKALAFLMLAACGEDFSYAWDGAIAPADLPDVLTEDRAETGGLDTGSEAASFDASPDVSAEASVDAVSVPDAEAGAPPVKCPTQGQGCAMVGDRICGDDTHYWYCDGQTWTRNDCGQFVPVCGYGSDGGLQCIKPWCSP